MDTNEGKYPSHYHKKRREEIECINTVQTTQAHPSSCHSGEEMEEIARQVGKKVISLGWEEEAATHPTREKRPCLLLACFQKAATFVETDTFTLKEIKD